MNSTIWHLEFLSRELSYKAMAVCWEIMMKDVGIVIPWIWFRKWERVESWWHPPSAISRNLTCLCSIIGRYLHWNPFAPYNFLFCKKIKYVSISRMFDWRCLSPFAFGWIFPLDSITCQEVDRIKVAPNFESGEKFLWGWRIQNWVHFFAEIDSCANCLL